MEARILGRLSPTCGEGQIWESLVASSPQSGFMQSLHWAEVKRRQGMGVLHIGLYESGALIGGSLLYFMPDSKPAGLLVAPEGPVLPWSDEERSRKALSATIELAERHAHECNAMAVRLEPRVVGPTNVVMDALPKAPVDLIPRETLLLSLKESDRNLLAAMKPKTRYNIGLSQRRGVEVVERTSSRYAERFHDLLEEAAQRDGFFAEPPEFFANILDVLGPKGLARLFFAEYAGEPLGALLLITYGNRATYLYGGISNRRRNLMIGYALQWHAIQFAKNVGCTMYDFYGFDQFGDPSHGYSKFSRFKRGFGGQPVRYMGAHDHFFLDSLADAVIKTLCEINESDADVVQFAAHNQQLAM